MAESTRSGSIGPTTVGTVVAITVRSTNAPGCGLALPRHPVTVFTEKGPEAAVHLKETLRPAREYPAAVLVPANRIQEAEFQLYLLRNRISKLEANYAKNPHRSKNRLAGPL